MLQTPPLLRLGFSAVLAVIITVGMLAAAALGRAEDSSQLVLNTEQVLAQIEAVLTRSVDAETGTRGVLLTGDAQLLEPFNQAERELKPELDELARLTADNPRQQQRLELLRTQVGSHIQNLRLQQGDYEHGRVMRPRLAVEQRT